MNCAPPHFIKGYASILATGKLGELPEEARLSSEKNNRHSDELTRMVQVPLDIARIESADIQRQNPGLAQRRSGAADLLGGQLKERAIHFETMIRRNRHTFLPMPAKLTRVLINLIGNALKFTPPEGTISVYAHKHG